MSLFGTAKPFGFAPITTTSTTTPAFGAPATTSAAFGGFGFGTNLGGQTSSSVFPTSTLKPASGTFGTFGTNSTPFQGFGLGAAKTTASLFGSALTTTTSATQPTLGLFGTQMSQPSTGLGGGFSFQQQAPTAFGAAQKPAQPFTFNPASTSLQQSGQLQFSQQQQQLALQQQQQQQQLPQPNVDCFFSSLSQPMLFGDERDSVIARWNQLQAMWGTGVGYSAMGVATYTPENTFARFKAIAYNILPSSTDADGLVCLFLTRPFSEVLAQRQGLQDFLFRLLGGRPNLQLVIEEIRPCTEAENQTEVILKVVERQATGTTTNIPASELTKFLSTPTVASQLQSQLCANRLISEVSPSAAQLMAYNENPPAGVDRLIWQQARLDNPCPSRMIPVPLIGFADLRRRKRDQLAYGEQQSITIKQISELVQKMRTGRLTMLQRVTQLKRKQIELSHRVLKVLARQEVLNRSGFAISADEEALRCGLERIWAELTAPRGLRIRFQESLATLRASTNSSSTIGDKENKLTHHHATNGSSNLTLDSESVAELKEYLTQRHNGIREMQRLIMEMTSTLKVIEENPISDLSTHLSHLGPNMSVNKVQFAI